MRLSLWKRVGMARHGLPDVHVVGAPLGTVQGLTVAVVTAEVWHDHLTVRIAPVVDGALRAALSGWSDAMDRWRSRTDLQSRQEPPQHPAEIALQRVAVNVVDESGNAYTRVSGLVGGTHTELRGEWHYHPIPDGAAQALIISAAGVENPRRVEVALH